MRSKNINIIIFGFAHSGTSILKSIIGHCDNVYEHIYESATITHPKQNKYNLCKYPYYIPNIDKNPIYTEYHKIFLMRNPVFVYSSMNKRFLGNITDERLSVENYLRALQEFDRFRHQKTINISTILYKDLFVDNYVNVKNILNHIGIHYNDKVFDNTRYTNLISRKVSQPPKHQPNATDHDQYRTFQINLPFENMNNVNNINLTHDQLTTFKNNPLIQKYFPENRSLL